MREGHPCSVMERLLREGSAGGRVDHFCRGVGSVLGSIQICERLTFVIQRHAKPDEVAKTFGLLVPILDDKGHRELGSMKVARVALKLEALVRQEPCFDCKGDPADILEQDYGLN